MNQKMEEEKEKEGSLKKEITIKRAMRDDLDSKRLLMNKVNKRLSNCVDPYKLVEKSRFSELERGEHQTQ